MCLSLSIGVGSNVLTCAHSAAVGVRVAYREFDFGGNGSGMSPDDVVDMYPVGKYHVSPGLNSGALLDLGRGRLTQGALVADDALLPA